MVDELQLFTVKIANGSGCLFQPLSDNYSYVLTAKHVIEDEENLEIIRQFINIEGQQINEEIDILEPPYLHSDPNKDAAIVKVKKVKNLTPILRVDLNSIEKNNWYLCGHPESREENNFSYRKNKLALLNPVNNYIEAEIEKNVNHSEIVGQSGGGIIKIENSCFLLAGVQKKMAAKDEQESLSRIHFAPLTFFDEIVEKNKDKLSQLFPPYIGTFNFLLKEIFPLPNLLVKADLIKQTLNSISKKVCEGAKPEKIINDYTGDFLVKGTPKHIIYHKTLWKSLLEFFTIIKLYEEDIALNDLASIHKRRKMLIVDADKWTMKLEDIYKSDLSEIEKGGTIVVCATNEVETNKTEILPDELVVIDISTPIDEMNISSTVEDPFRDLRLVNIFKFQDHVINNAFELASINSINSKSKIKLLTDGII
ncbi:ABC-three component system protein [Aquimarina rhabdastrellae]